MSNKSQPISIYLTSRFKKDLGKLSKLFRSIREDLVPLIDQLQGGETLGDLIAGVKYQVFKVRLKNRDIQKGKSAGYRVLYYLKKETNIILATIYAKSDQADIENKVIESIIEQFEQEN
ncbi:type II toxin-antitoxin system RelE/ParE family toxin [Crocosphaera sp. Alani8]|uniref:type II toxin-antitoxin system RelE/ParE family toxin n=1 Tax=Crocosphaera sp. Alani8 TaxID=3038952 RepID=UPI00313E75ED